MEARPWVEPCTQPCPSGMAARQLIWWGSRDQPPAAGWPGLRRSNTYCTQPPSQHGLSLCWGVGVLQQQQGMCGSFGAR